MDEYAPLVFINGADYKAAQMFTLAHELAHVFIGADGVSSFDALEPSPHATELHCNNIAAEFLIEGERMRAFWGSVARRSDLLPENRSTDNWSPPVKQRRTACGGAGLRTSRSSGS